MPLSLIQSFRGLQGLSLHLAPTVLAMAAWLAPLPLAMGQRPEFIEFTVHLKKTGGTLRSVSFEAGTFFHDFHVFSMRCGALIRLARLGSALPAVMVALLLRSKPQGEIWTLSTNETKDG